MTETEWLSDREQETWRDYLHMVAAVEARLNGVLQRACGLSSQDYGVLVNLSEAPDQRMRAFALGQALTWEKSRLSHHLTRMESRGLVERSHCPSDGRGAFIGLTDAGRRAIEEAAPRHVESVRALFIDRLDPVELGALADICRKVLDHLGDEGDLCQR